MYGLRVTGYGLRVAGCGLQVAGCRLRVAGSGFNGLGFQGSWVPLDGDGTGFIINKNRGFSDETVLLNGKNFRHLVFYKSYNHQMLI